MGALTHPLVGPPVVLAAGVVLGGVLWAVVDQTAGIVLVGVFGVPGLVYAAFLAVLLAHGSPLFRNEGPRPGLNDMGVSGTREALPVLIADRIRVCGCPMTDPTALQRLTANIHPSCILMGQCPGRKRKGAARDLLEDLHALKEIYRVDTIVSLVEQRELDVMLCGSFGTEAERLGMKWIHSPIRDKWIPETDAFVRHLVAPLAHVLARSSRPRNVYIHCNGGKGRTALLVAALLLTRSVSSLNLHSIVCMSTCPHAAPTAAEATCGHLDLPPLKSPLNPDQSIACAVDTIRFARPGTLKNPLQRMYLWHIREKLLEL